MHRKNDNRAEITGLEDLFLKMRNIPELRLLPIINLFLWQKLFFGQKWFLGKDHKIPIAD